MGIMLKKFKEKIQHIIENDDSIRKIDFENKNIELNGIHYLICRAVVSSIPEILSVERSSYSGRTPHNYEFFENEIESFQSNLVLLVRCDDRVIAYSDCIYNKKSVIIKDIAIVPRFRHKGIFRAIINIIIKEAVKMKCVNITVNIPKNNFNIQKLYKGFGFIEKKDNSYHSHNNDSFRYEYLLNSEN